MTIIVHYDTNIDLVKTAVSHLSQVFECWKSKPVFIADMSDETGESELKLEMSYEDGTEFETEHAHEALSLAQAFIDGYVLGKTT